MFGGSERHHRQAGQYSMINSPGGVSTRLVSVSNMDRNRKWLVINVIIRRRAANEREASG